MKIQIRLAIQDGGDSGNVADVEIEYREVSAYCIPLCPSPAKG